MITIISFDIGRTLIKMVNNKHSIIDNTKEIVSISSVDLKDHNQLFKKIK